MKKFLIIFISLLIFIVCYNSSSEILTIERPFFIRFQNYQFTYDNINELVNLIKKEENHKEVAHNMAECARKLGYGENHNIIVIAKQEWQRANSRIVQLNNIKQTLEKKLKQKKHQYPEAYYIWSYFKNLGYSNEVCAGIMGNIMAEVGGQTLNLDIDLTTNNYYGICQWSKSYSDIWEKSLKDQCDYLKNTIEYEFNTYGYKYQKGFKYKDFQNLTNMKDVALAFAKSYERCNSRSYKVRQNNAVIAYNYFVS